MLQNSAWVSGSQPIETEQGFRPQGGDAPGTGFEDGFAE